MASQPRVRRRALACARCRVRKVHCDARSPSCTRCLDAGVHCVGMDSATKQAVPRSIAQYLETQIAEMERETSRQSLQGYGQHHDTSAEDSFTNPAVNKLMEDLTPSFLGLSATVPLARCVVAGTRLPSARKVFGAVNDIDEHHPRSIMNPQPTTTPLSSIPVHVADFLFDNYVTRVVPQHPIFYLPDLIRMQNTVFHGTEFAGQPKPSINPYEVFTLSLIMAISLSTAARTKQARANSIASGLFKNAMEQVPNVASNDLQGLQALLLLMQYAFLNPSVANLWLLTGFTSQACIDLGLHQELPYHRSVSTLERDMRRRIFWCAWEMEIAVCGALLRPITILQKYITTSFPSQVEDSAISTHGIDPNGKTTKFTSQYIWRFRQVESDIVPVLFHNEAVPSEFESLDSWMSYQEHKILDWKAEVHDAAAQGTDTGTRSQWNEMTLYAGIATAYILVTLFRPCPRIKEPSAENLIKAFAAAVEVATGYWQQANLDFGNSKYVFHPCHHTFSSAVVFLQALQRFKGEIAALYTLEQVESYMSAFSRLFATVAERWPAASRCLEEYERLLAPVKKDFVDFLVQKARRLSEQASTIDELVGPIGIDDATSLEDALNFGTLFNASGTA
ncbi:hypothetical protein NA57DRAFT_68117 [Rhizodiscina lignyota]|uniref:Zn(2)-C6 fungal-type domain-containing protein n=1 Tax=Rhizodiscina lignyota TaxID=1504668 RepID=A0A9P4M6S2_9PEZI|nr:hypothetical protein NA57DRAFT_68117 [Rhizodiscina lignyota]